MTSPADTIRRAATLLRERAADATEGPWFAEHPEARFWGDQQDARIIGGRGKILTALPDEWNGHLNADWIATMHPGVGVALAAWLELEADVIAARTATDGSGEYAVDISGDHALAVARAVLGEGEPCSGR